MENSDSSFYNIFGIGSGIIWYLYFSLCLYFIAQKLGKKDAWAAFIPFFNIYYFFDLAGSAIGCFFIWIPIVNIILAVLAWGEICKKLKESQLWALITIFPPFSIITYTYLAFFAKADQREI